MKTLRVIICLFFLCAVASAQNNKLETRAIALKILDKKERPVRNVVVQSVNTGKGGMTDRSGVFVFEDMSDDDKISIMMKNNGQIVIPVAGMELIVVKTTSSKLYSYENKGTVMNVKLERPLASDDNTILDVQAMLKQRSYSSLIELLQGNVAGLNISTNDESVTMGRGPTSINSGNQPMVVLDGVVVGSVATANSMVNVHNIKTIEIQKNASGYGIRGANGVIVINTR